MSKALDELKELEARRQELYDHARTQHNRIESFGEIMDAHDYAEAPTYRRLALEVAALVEQLENDLTSSQMEAQALETEIINYDYFHHPVIYDPTDKRVVVGRVYEFCNTYTFAKHRYQKRGVLVEAYKDSTLPFQVDVDTSDCFFAFIRELPKEERGES